MERHGKEAAMGAGRYDVIVVGARIAGAATAMLLARQGMRVLAVDRVCFLSDTVSSHQLQVPGVAGLHQWGLLGQLTAAGTPPVRRVHLDAGGGLIVDGQFPACGGAPSSAQTSPQTKAAGWLKGGCR
jgi:2-polyprenyl-6-methoxyphenol hydroxylase-like FAD-dependent oxidoreductase